MASYFEETTNFFAASGSWEKWTIISVDALNRPVGHPIHIHLMNFQLLERHAVDGSTFDSGLFGTTKPITIKGAIPIAPGESGWKDTVTVPVNTMVTLAVRFDRQTGRGMYHCHILDHEDGGMMRPLVVLPPTVLTVQNMTMAMNMSAFNPAMKSGMAAMPSIKGGMDAMPGMGH